jgi:hypothetical protein
MIPDRNLELEDEMNSTGNDKYVGKLKKLSFGLLI